MRRTVCNLLGAQVRQGGRLGYQRRGFILHLCKFRKLDGVCSPTLRVHREVRKNADGLKGASKMRTWRNGTWVYSGENKSDDDIEPIYRGAIDRCWQVIAHDIGHHLNSALGAGVRLFQQLHRRWCDESRVAAGHPYCFCSLDRVVLFEKFALRLHDHVGRIGRLEELQHA